MFGSLMMLASGSSVSLPKKARSSLALPKAARMRPVLSKDEVDRLIDSIDEIPTAWEEDPQLRKANFDALLRSSECRNLIVLIKTLNAHRERRKASGKALHVSDETFLREAQRLLYDEFAGALGIQPDQVRAYIQTKLGQTT